MFAAASAARRSTLTAVAACALLGGLWFVPTTHATVHDVTPAADTEPGSATTARQSDAAHAPDAQEHAGRAPHPKKTASTRPSR